MTNQTKDGAFSICHICLKKEMIITIYFTYLNDQRSEKKTREKLPPHLFGNPLERPCENQYREKCWIEVKVITEIKEEKTKL